MAKGWYFRGGKCIFSKTKIERLTGLTNVYVYVAQNEDLDRNNPVGRKECYYLYAGWCLQDQNSNLSVMAEYEMA